MSHLQVLVTGAHGFLGRHVARRCAELGWTVTGIGHGSWVREDWTAWGIAEWCPCDVNVFSMLTYSGEPDLVFHCAGSGSVAFSLSHPYQDYQRTVATAVELLEFARIHAPVAKLVYPSSAAVYGASRRLPQRETDPANPVSIYGLHKRIVEELIITYARDFRLSASVVRLFSVYGPGLRKQLLWDACNKVSRRQYAFFGLGTEQRDWLHVEDAASLMIEAGRRADSSCPLVNGATGEGVAVAEILAHLFCCFGIEETPTFLGTSRQGDPEHFVADVSRVSEWGWRPTIDWRSGIGQYVEWFRRENQGAPEPVGRVTQ